VISRFNFATYTDRRHMNLKHLTRVGWFATFVLLGSSCGSTGKEGDRFSGDVADASLNDGDITDSTENGTAIANQLRIHPTNPIWFTDNSGRAIYLSGHQIFNDMHDLWGGKATTLGPSGSQGILDFDWYLGYAKSRGMNHLRNWSTFSFGKGPTAANAKYYADPLPYVRTGPGTALDGRPKFDLTKLDENYFNRLRDRVRKCQDNGIYVGVMLFEVYSFLRNGATTPNTLWGGNVFNSANNINGISTDTNRDGNGLEGYFFTPSATVRDLQKAYVRKVIDTVNEFDNVYYEIANELHAPAWQAEIISYIRAYEATKDKKHLILRSPGGRNASGNVTDSPIAEVVEAADLYAIAGSWPGFSEGVNVPPNKRQKPGLWDNDHVWPANWRDSTQVWKAFTRGYHYTLYDDPFEDPPEESTTFENTRFNIGAAVSYSKRADLGSMTPQNQLSSTTYCLASSGREYIVFNPGSSSSFTVSGLQSGATYSLEWYNTNTHTAGTASTIKVGSSTQQFKPPFSDAVLYLRLQPFH